MTGACPKAEEWTRLADGEATANRAAELERHAASCAACAAKLDSARVLFEDIAAPVPTPDESVARVMRALDDEWPQAEHGARSFAFGMLAGGAVVAAAVAVLFLVFRPSGTPDDPGTFTARGGSGGDSIARKVGVDLHADGLALEAGQRVSPETAYTASVRNLLADRPVYALVFALDRRGDVHWLYPGFTDPSTDPEAIELPRTPGETALAEGVVLDAPASGELLMVTVLSFERLRVSDIENAPAPRRTPAALRERWPDAEVRTLTTVVQP